MGKTKLIGLRGRDEKGYTLLEYCAGAAVIAGIIFAALQTMGSNLSGYLGAIGSWATRRAADISS
ncbi:MAG: Flp family type IVb pilin [Deltaproteobacteria bacterium]|nr:Flp family type IVb pilin [Deltaproteobacteria bacterium]